MPHWQTVCRTIAIHSLFLFPGCSKYGRPGFFIGTFPLRFSNFHIFPFAHFPLAHLHIIPCCAGSYPQKMQEACNKMLKEQLLV
jgi:hypothetical protein